VGIVSLLPTRFEQEVVTVNSEELFRMALGIDSPWLIKSVNFEQERNAQVLKIEVDFKRGSTFPDSQGQLCTVHDTVYKTWRHLNFFQHACYINCRTPRIKTPDGKVKLVTPPWAREGSGFTLLFEALAMALIESEMPVNKIGRLMNENPHRIWTIFNYWVAKARANDKLKQPSAIGFDETSKRKGHDYVTLAVDLKEKKVIYVAEGKGKSAIHAVKSHLIEQSLDVHKVHHASIDMSPSYISGVTGAFPKAEIHFDRFHVVKLLNEAMDEVRKLERREHSELKGHKYTFLKNKDKLSKKKAKELSDLITLFPTLGKAYRLKELFNDIWEMDTEEEATEFLADWCKEVEAEGIGPFKKFVRTIKAHWTGIVNFCEKQISNGILEGINSKVQLAKRRARGYRKTENLINMIYFLCGKLKFNYPLVFS
jgi:transposase